jgi:hypothetical protein
MFEFEPSAANNGKSWAMKKALVGGLSVFNNLSEVFISLRWQFLVWFPELRSTYFLL